ncbi:MAG: biopolymer transporter ExbD [Lentisphaerae bacterium]|nr:MAG: biopolymer transporter ExbD [Lentisphaerota bacterium]
MIESGYEHRKARVEMLPLIDVVFLLLVFFIYAMMSMAVVPGIEIELPATGKADSVRPHVVSIAIRRDNTMIVDGKRILEDRLIQEVHRLMQANRAQSVQIYADRKSALGLTIRVLDQLKNAGITQVTVACKKRTP